MSSILPSFAEITITSQDAVQRSTAGSMKEYDVDFETGQLNGRLVDGAEAVKVWIWKCLLTARFHFPIYSWIYGSELESYLGKVLPEEYIKTDVRLALEDALLINPEIVEVRNFSGYQRADSLILSLEVVTIYGVISILDYDINIYKTASQRAYEQAKKIINSGIVRFWIDRNGHLLCSYPEGLRQSLEFTLKADHHLYAAMTERLAEDLTLTMTDNGHVEATLYV